MFYLFIIIIYTIFIVITVSIAILFLHITTIILNYRVSTYFAFRRWSHNEIHLGKLFYSFPVLIKHCPSQIREIFKNDLINYAIPKTLEIRPNASIFINTHLITEEELKKLSEYESLTYSQHIPTLGNIISIQIIAIIACFYALLLLVAAILFPKYMDGHGIKSFILIQKNKIPIKKRLTP